ncbi:hypothetical protein NQ314_021057 [Rhamnusium bicolor]|uniref:Transposase Helix-turn-helix domain-containing protein n=1 Tax=Rhamnusium bicolor TaxID=1586634 RepID=A0AAV8WJ00_9CUCU|nr:hypothetical protein NQ314_021057 [Rhamnusium bicolor]
MERAWYDLVKNYSLSEFYPKEPHAVALTESAECHVLCFLWFAGNKSSLRDVAQKFGIGLTTLFSQNDKVIDYLISIAPTLIKIPTLEVEKRKHCPRI